MGIVKADFDWISLLVVVVAGIIGMIKSGTKKTSHSPVDIPREYVPEMEREETVEWFNDPDIATKSSAQENREEMSMPGDSYKETEEQPLFISVPEEDTESENEELRHFNLRQAIIGSEILRRPEY